MLEIKRFSRASDYFVVGVVSKTFRRMIKDQGGNQRHVKDGRRRVVVCVC